MKQAKAHRERPDARPFYLENVDEKFSFSSKLQRSFIVLNAGEYARVFGSGPRAKDPKTPVIEVGLPDGSTETLYCFADGDNPHRRLIVGTEVSQSRCATILPQAQHFHEEQAMRTVKASQSARMERSGEQALLSASGLAHLSSIQEFQSKMAKRWQTQQSQPSSASVMEAVRPPGEVEGASSENSDEEQAGDDFVGSSLPSATLREATATAAAAAAQKARSLCGGRANLEKELSAESSKKKGKPLARLASSRSLETKLGLSEDAAVDDSASKTQRDFEHDLQNMASDKLVAKWIGKFP